MVTHETERRDGPSNSLDRVRELAAQGSVIYASSKIQRDMDALGYQLSDVCTTIRALESANFSHSERYGGSQLWLDVYLTAMLYDKKYIDRLYVKLKLSPSCMAVVLHSFHRERET